MTHMIVVLGFVALSAASLNAAPPDAAGERPPVIPPYPAGVISYRLTYSPASARHPTKCIISDLRVRPGYRRKGTARLICQQIITANADPQAPRNAGK